MDLPLDKTLSFGIQTRMPTPTTGGPPDVAETMAAAIREAAEQANTDTGRLEGVGVGSPGAVADDEGTVAAPRNLPDWEEAYPLRDDLASRLDTRVRLDGLRCRRGGAVPEQHLVLRA